VDDRVGHWFTSFARALIPAPGETPVGRGCGLDVFGPGIATIAGLRVMGWSLDMLTISPEKVCYVIAKARELEVKVAPEELDDDGMGRILEAYADDPTLEELRGFLEAQSDDELSELLALAWVGRGDFAADEWQDALGQIRDVREQHTVDYLLGTPLLSDYLEEGLSHFGHVGGGAGCPTVKHGQDGDHGAAA
jgi:Protein of unknown function (DUF3775)